MFIKFEGNPCGKTTNDPEALLRMVLQSGQVFQNRLPMAQQAIVQALAGRR